MKATKLIFAVVATLLLIAVAGMAYLVIYLDRHKGLLELRASEMLGREVRIEHGVAWHWSMKPSITLKGLWIGNPDWAGSEYLAHAERLVLRLDLTALLQRRLDVTQMTLQNADIVLETAANGKHNWSFGGDGGSGVRMGMHALQVEDSRLRYRSPDGADHRVEVSDLTFRDPGNAPLELEAELTYHAIPLSVSGTTKADSTLRSAGWPFSGRLQTPHVNLAITGDVTGPLEFAHLELVLQSDRLDLAESLSLLWPDIPVGGSLRQITGRFNTAGDTAQALLHNLAGELKVGSAALTLAAKKGRDGRDLVFNKTSLKLAPKQLVRLESGVVYEKQSFQLELIGGLLADLLSSDKSWKTVKLKAKGQYATKPLEITGHIGPLSALLAGHGLGVSLSVNHNELHAQLEGTVASLDMPLHNHFAIEVEAPSLSRLTPWFGLEMPESSPFTFAAQTEGSERHLKFKDLKLITGEIAITGEMSLPLTQGERIEARLESDVLDLTTLIPPSGLTAGDAKPILEQELPPEVFQGLDGAVRFKVGRLRARDFEMEDASLDAILDQGHLKLTMKAEGERLTADIDLKPAGTQWQFALHHKGDLDIAWLTDGHKQDNDPAHAPMTIDMQLNGTGRSLAGVLGSAEGDFIMELGAGRLSKSISQHLPLGDVLFTVLSALGPAGQGQSEQVLECAVIQLKIADGIAVSSQGLALRTDKINVLGGGALKLRTGEIDLHFKTAKRKGLGVNLLGIADRFLRLTGTLQSPAVELNVGGFLTHGSAAWATGGVSLLYDSILTRLTAFNNPCQTVLKASTK